MINDKELQISKESYIKKDFYQIYPEILDLVSKISERWDPQSSNESDPGVVLLKLLAFIADKNNYNIDKNILEAFMPTASQESSMRKLCDMMGYNIKYYQSATTSIALMYQGSVEDINFKLKAFDTVFTNIDNDISYVLLDDVTIDDKYQTVYGNVMEGVYCEAVAGSSSTITMASIDDNNRFYFPESMVAENGIFVKDINNGTNIPWTKVDNLNFYPIGSRVYKFGFDSRRSLPFIEFPDDIVSLINEGLKINYIRTTGINGNIKAGTLTKFKSYSTNVEVNLGDDDNGNPSMVISNLSSASNGRNKETLEEAYNGFKKTVGTYETLVTCRDYANKIYQLVRNDNTTPLVSNIQVADIRDDINMSYGVMTFDDNGPNKTIVVEGGHTNYDLVVYPFRAITGAYTKSSFNNSFTPESSNLSDIKAGVENYKTIAHNIILPENNNIYCIKNKYNVSAQITTTYKVNTIEQAEILDNIYTALYKKFNLRELDFGEPLSFDAVFDCIKGADTRIKNVSLKDLNDIDTYILNKAGTETELFNSSSYYDYLAKNVLAGKISLYDYNNDFDFIFGQEAKNGVNTFSAPIASITTKAKIDYKTSSEILQPYTLKKNQIVQFRAPNLRTYLTYPAYVKYWIHLDSTSVIEANSEYALQPGDYLCVSYTDTNDNTQYIKYEYNKTTTYNATGVTKEESKPYNIIKPNFQLKPFTGDESLLLTLDPNPFGTVLGPSDSGNGMLSLGVSEQIEMRDYVNTTLGKQTFCYWIVADSLDSNDRVIGKIPFKQIGSTGVYEYTLQDGEYFFYTNDTKTELATLGSGTKIITNVEDADISPIFTIYYDDDTLNKDDIMEDGLAAFSDIEWKSINLTKNSNPSSGTYITLQEMQLITLTEDDVLLYVDPSTAQSPQTLTNDWLPINNAAYIFTSTGESKILPALLINTDTWEVRSRLDLNVGPKSIQHLADNDEVVVNFISSGSDTYTDIDINTNYILQKAGGENITTQLIKYNDIEDEISIIDDFTIYAYDNTGSTKDSSIYNLPISSTNTVSIDIDKDFTTNIVTHVIVPTNNDAKFLVYFSGTSDTVQITADGSYLTNTAAPASAASSINIKQGINIINVNHSCSLTITKSSGATGILTLGGLSMIKGLNPAFDAITASTLLTKINTLAIVDGRDIFYYNYPIGNDNIIDTKDMKDPFALYDYNNVYNKFVVSQLNTNPNGSKKTFPNITITAGSKL